MKRTYRVLKFKAKFLAYFALVAVLLYVVVGRLLLSQLSEYRESLEKFLSAELQLPVEVGQLVAKWSGFDPILEVRGVAINGANNAHLKTAQVRFAFLESLLERTPKVKEIRLENVNLALAQKDDGGWLLAGLDLENLALPQGESNAPFHIEDVLDGANLKLVDAFVRVSSPNEGERVWRLPSASLSYVAGRIYAQGNVIRPDGLQPLLRFVYNSSELGGDSALEGELFVEARSASFLDRLIQNYSWQGLSILELDASGRAWLNLSGLTPESVYAEVQVNQLNWKLKEKSLAPIVQSTVSFAWHGNEHGHRFDLYGLDLNWRGDRCSVPGAILEASGTSWKAGVSTVDLACVSDILLTLDVLDPQLNDRLIHSAPTGQLQNMTLNLAQDDAGSLSMEFEAELDSVGLNSYEGAPTLTGVDGYIYSNLEEGFVQFESESFGLYFPDLYLKSWKSNDARGRVNWRTEGEDFVVESEGLYLKLYNESEVFGDFLIRLNDDQHEDYLGLMLGMRNIAVENVDDFVPFYVVDESLYQWLSDSLTEGYVSEGMYMAYGNIEAQSPENSFTSSLNVRTANASLRFDPDWPELRNLNLDVVLHEDHLEIDGKDAQIAGSQVAALEVEMPSTTKESEKPVLSVKARLSASDSDYTYWLSESPIADATEELADQIEFSGKSDVNLELDLTLDDEISTEYRVEVDTKGVTAKLRDTHLSMAEVRGRVVVDSIEGVSSKNLVSKFHDEPAKLDIFFNPQADATFVKLSGRFKVEDLNFPDADWNYGLSGATEFVAQLEIPSDAELGTNLRITSDLLGIASDWPAPLTKHVDSRNPAEIDIEFKAKQNNIQFKLNGSALPQSEGELLMIDNSLEYGRIVLSSETHPLKVNDFVYADEGIGVAAQLDYLDVESWVNYISDRVPKLEGDESAVFREIRLDSPVVNVFDKTVTDVSARIFPGERATRVSLDSDHARGEIELPLDDSPLTVRLSRLVLESESDDADYTTEEVVEPMDPRNIASMSFAVDEMIVGADNWGAWSFWTDSDEYGVVLRNLKGNVQGSVIEGQLTWQFDDGQSHTILTADLDGENIEPLMTLFGQQSPLVSDRYSADLAMVWPDAPFRFELARTSGSAKLSFEDGVIRSDNEANGILKLFGLFSLDALARRLRLDFSDVYKSGISYDTVSIDAVMDQGRLSFVQPMKIDGPSSNYTLRGDVDMGQQTLDLKMLVALPISSNVPIAGLMLGNPAVGGAVWLVDKILGEPLSKLSTIRYAITGSWDDPKMTLEKAINAK